MTLELKKVAPVNDLMKSNTFILGKPKVGKTTFASTFNKGKGVLLLATEIGYNYLDDTDITVVDIKRWQDLYEVAKNLETEWKDQFQVLVIDTIDRLWRKLETHEIKKYNSHHKTKEDQKVDDVNDIAGGYGKGSKRVKDEFDRVVNGFNQMGYPVVFISHTKTVDEDGVAKTMSSLSGKAEEFVTGSCDFIFYVYSDRTGKRLIRTREHTVALAGSRSKKLPEIIEMDFNKIQQALKGKENGKHTN